MKSDTSVWDNEKRLRTTILNLAKMILVIVALDGYYLFQEKHWIILTINIIYGLIIIPLFISHAVWNKRPPKQEEVKK